MKSTKRLVSLLLALVLTMGLTIPAGAAGAADYFAKNGLTVSDEAPQTLPVTYVVSNDDEEDYFRTLGDGLFQLESCTIAPSTTAGCNTVVLRTRVWLHSYYEASSNKEFLTAQYGGYDIFDSASGAILSEKNPCSTEVTWQGKTWTVEYKAETYRDHPGKWYYDEEGDGCCDLVQVKTVTLTVPADYDGLVLGLYPLFELGSDQETEKAVYFRFGTKIINNTIEPYFGSEKWTAAAEPPQSIPLSYIAYMEEDTSVFKIFDNGSLAVVDVDVESLGDGYKLVTLSLEAKLQSYRDKATGNEMDEPTWNGLFMDYYTGNQLSNGDETTIKWKGKTWDIQVERVINKWTDGEWTDDADGNSVKPWTATMVWEIVAPNDYDGLVFAVRRYRENGSVQGMEAATIFRFGTEEVIKEPSIPASGTARPSTQKVNVDGKMVEFPMYAVQQLGGVNSYNYIKLRDLASILNGTAASYNLGWDSKESAINILSKTPYQPDGTEMKTPFSGDRAYELVTSKVLLDGRNAGLEIINIKDDAGNGYTYVKLADLGRALDFNVYWDGAVSGIVVQTDKPYTGTK